MTYTHEKPRMEVLVDGVLQLREYTVQYAGCQRTKVGVVPTYPMKVPRLNENELLQEFVDGTVRINTVR